jgi:hypothetical protein
MNGTMPRNGDHVSGLILIDARALDDLLFLTPCGAEGETS